MNKNSLRSLAQMPVTSSTAIMGYLLVLLYVLACVYLQPVFDIAGDAPSYLEAMRVLNGMPEPEHFTPNRLLTTPGMVGVVAALGWLVGETQAGYMIVWFLVNSLFFFGLGFASYFLFCRVLNDRPASILATLFVMANYDVLVFGLNYLTDIGGWFFFALSLLFLFQAIESGEDERRNIWYAALAAGVGVLFKEYAFFAFVPLGIFLLYRYGREPMALIRRSLPILVALLPMLAVHAGVYLTYGYTYLDWYAMNREVYGFENWFENAIKSYGIVMSVLAPIALIGLVLFVRQMRLTFDAKRTLFVAAMALPGLAVFLWPSITQRLVFLSVPFAALLAGYAFKQWPRALPVFAALWAAYLVIAVTTDGYILPTVNIL